MLEIMRVMWYNTMGCDTVKTINKAVWQIDGGVPQESLSVLEGIYRKYCVDTRLSRG